MYKIIIVDDHTLFRIGITGILKKETFFEVIGEYGSFASIKPLISSLTADIILLDISLPNESGLEAVKYIKNSNPRLKAVILSSHKEEFYLSNALEAGADGYIHKSASAEELIMGLKKVMAGEKFYSQEIASLLINSMHSKGQKGFLYLTNKEKQVVSFLQEGYSSKEIAEKLEVSPRTIERHRSNILNKFGLKNTTELIKKITEQKIHF